ncbi:MAG: hypothetical protein AB7K24_21875, partial [Gemmataceae bacterium]
AAELAAKLTTELAAKLTTELAAKLTTELAAKLTTELAAELTVELAAATETVEVAAAAAELAATAELPAELAADVALLITLLTVETANGQQRLRIGRERHPEVRRKIRARRQDRSQGGSGQRNDLRFAAPGNQQNDTQCDRQTAQHLDESRSQHISPPYENVP